MKKRLVIALGAISLAGAWYIPTSSATADYLDASIAQSLSQIMPRPINATSATYFVLTDRYANGSEDNDYGSGSFQSSIDTNNMYAYHGGDFVGLTANLDRLKRLGMTAIWVTPPVANSDNGYHGYWGVDFLNVDPHLGTNEEFATFVNAAHAKGMKVIMDIVVNHTADVITYDSDQGTFYNLDERPYKNAAGTNFDLLAAAQFTSTCASNGDTNCFPILNANSFPHQFSQNSQYFDALNPAFLKEGTNYHNRGDANDCHWSVGDCQMYGDFSGLDDVFTEKPEVVQGWIDTYAFWVTEYKIDGFRFDTAKHVNKEFWDQFVPAMNAAAASVGKPELTMFSESWMTSPYELADWFRDNAAESALDFPSQQTFTEYADGMKNGSSLLGVIARDDYFNTGNQPNTVTKNAYGLTTFLGNHDMGRGNAFIAGSTSDSGANLTARAKLANAVMFLLRGAPSVYYGDELGLIGGMDEDGAKRQDLMSTTWYYDWQVEPRIGANPRGTKSLLSASNETHPLFRYIATLQSLRRKYPALTDGAVIPRISTGKVAAWSRIRLDSTKTDSRREYVVVTNSGTKSVTLTVPTAMKSAKFVGVLGTTKTFTTNKTYGLKITIPARMTYLFRAASLVPGVTSAPRPTLTIEQDSFASQALLSARAYSSVKNPLSVTFVARADANASWQVIGTDDSPTDKYYNLLIGDWVWGDHTSMQFAAITRTSNGKTSGSIITTVNRADVDPGFNP
jgi:glycosidase